MAKTDSRIVSWTINDDGSVLLVVGRHDPKSLDNSRIIVTNVLMGEDAEKLIDILSESKEESLDLKA